MIYIKNLFIKIQKKLQKKLKGWKTVILNLLATVLPILELSAWHDILPVGFLSWYIIFVALVNIWVRSFTNSPIGRKR